MVKSFVYPIPVLVIKFLDFVEIQVCGFDPVGGGELVGSLSRTGIFHVLFALFFSTLTDTILQILYYHPHHTRFKPFRLLT